MRGKLKLKKLRGKGIIEVDAQIERWRKQGKELMPKIETPRQRAIKAARIKKEHQAKARLFRMFEDV